MQIGITDLVRGGSLGNRRKLVEEHRAQNPVLNHFLKASANAPEPEIDHIFECQLLSHCIMQTKCLHPRVREVKVKASMSNQLYEVQNLLKPLQKLHNGLNTAASCFNLQLMDKNLKILKGAAITDFIRRQLSGEGGPVNFRSYLKGVQLENYGVDVNTLAAEMARSIRDVREPYIGYLHTLHLGGKSDAVTAKLRDGLIQTINRVFGNLFDDAMITNIATLNSAKRQT